jgi:hypothetical protein
MVFATIFFSAVSVKSFGAVAHPGPGHGGYGGRGGYGGGHSYGYARGYGYRGGVGYGYRGGYGYGRGYAYPGYARVWAPGPYWVRPPYPYYRPGIRVGVW